MRITSSMMSRQYAKNLNKSMNNLSTVSERATTYRRFGKASEDPFSAAKAYRLRRESQQNTDYQDMCTNVTSQLDTAQSAMMDIHSILSEINSGDCLQSINGTTSASDRSVIATKLRTVQGNIISSANTKFSDQYVFGGAQSDVVPFTINQDGMLFFRGVNVNTGELENGTQTAINNAVLQFGKDTGTAFNGYSLRIVHAAGSADNVSVSGSEILVTMDLSAGKTNADVLNALKSAGSLTAADGSTLDLSGIQMSGDLSCPVTDGMTSSPAYDNVGQDGLKALASEKAYVDLGLGLSFNADGTINSQSAFNTAIPGLSFLGYGTAEGTDISNNLYCLLGQIADQLESESYSYESLQPYLDNFNSQIDGLLAEVTKSGTKSTYLETATNRLQSIGDSISEKLSNVEFVEPSDALIDYKIQSAAYTAALQIGSSILKPSLLDFLD